MKAQILQQINNIQNEIASKYTNSLLDSLFIQQKNFILDKSKRKLARCTRRAGKSHAIAAYLIYSAYHNYNSNNLYLGLTQDSAKRIMWKTFIELKEKFKLEYEMLEYQKMIKFPNQSTILIYGADTLNLAKRLLGNKFSLIVADEAQSFRDVILKPLMEDVLEPTTMDADGTICLTGTPCPKLAGYFYEQDMLLKEYSKHHWTVYDNIYMPHAMEWVRQKKLEKKWSDNHPTYVREWLGQWCYDPDAMVYKFNRQKNLTYDNQHYHNYVIGLDLGWNDATTFSVIGYNDHANKAEIVKSEKYVHLIPSKIAEKLTTLVRFYNPLKIVADTGGLGKSIVEEFKQRYGFNIIAAEKTDKMAAIEMFNTDLLDGILSINQECNELIEQLTQLVYDENGKEDPSMPNDCCDSALYAHRFSRHYWARPKEPKLTEEEFLLQESLKLQENDYAISEENDQY